MEEMLSRMGSDEFAEHKGFCKLMDNPDLLRALTQRQTPDQIGFIFTQMAKSSKDKKK